MSTTVPAAEPLAPIDLAGLQNRLDQLPVGQGLAISISDYRRLFGLNEVAAGRVANFAKGHGCVIDASPSLITFRKTGPTRG